MKRFNINKISWDELDELRRPTPETTDFDRVVEAAVSRRGFLSGLVAFGSGAAVMGSGMLKGSTALAQDASRFAFSPIAAQTDFTVHVPEGYEWKTVASWGDPLFSDAPAFDPQTGTTVEGQARASARTPTAWSYFRSTAAR